MLKIRLFIAVLMLILPILSFAATCISVRNSNWSNPNAWSCGYVPAVTDTVVIANGFTVTLNKNYTVASLTISTGGVVSDSGKTLTDTGALVVNGTFGAGILISSGTNTAVTGTGTFSGTTLQISSGASFAAGNTPNFSAASITVTSGTLTNGATITAQAITLSGGSFANNGTVTVGTLTASSGTTWTQGNNSNLTLTTVSFSGTLNASNNGNTVTFPTGVAPIPSTSMTYYNISGPTCAQLAGYTILGTGPTCGTLNHLMIQSSGSGLTCAASTLTIVACQDAVCTPYTGGVTGTLIASSPVNWDGTTGGTTGSGFVIAAGTSLVTKNVQVATPGSVIFGISSAAPTPFNPTVCNFGSPACTFTASTAGFIFSNASTGNTYTIPPQVSGIAATGLYLRAVQASTVNPAVCTPAIINSTTAVNMGYTCNNPATCQPGSLTTINTTAVAPTGTPVSLSFDANGSSPITVRYDDVGQITLNANATVTPFGGAAPITLNGSSSPPYTVAPHHFGFSAVTAAPIKAGNIFSAMITSYNGLGTPTANFGLETPAQGVTLTQTLVSPTGPGVSAGALGAAAFTAYTGGATTATTNWSDVGIITLTATNSNYLGSGLSASGTSANIGAFIPDHYTTVVTQACSAGNFSYSGQPFGVQVNAKNGLAISGITVNYDGTANTTPNFANIVTLSDASGSTAGTLAPATVPATAFSAGVASVNPAYTFTSRTTAPTLITMRATYTNAAPAYTVTSSGFAEGSTNIYSGRARFNNAHGSENLALPVPFSTEYWSITNNGWVTNNADSCTGDVTLGAANALSVSLSSPPVTCVQDSGNPGLSGAGCAAAGPVVQRFIKGATPSIGFAGNFNLWLQAPGGSNSGAVTVTGNVPVWLQYPWGGGAAINPTARATFGVYKGPNQIIYMRENY